MDLKLQADNRLQAAAAMSNEQLASIVRQADPAFYNQITLGDAERKEYYFVHHQSITVTRTPYVCFFPALPDLKHQLLQLKQSTSDSDKELIQADLSLFFQRAKELGLTRFRNTGYDEDKLHFEHLPIEMFNNQVASHQPDYIIAEECVIEHCKICHGKKYVDCDYPPCGGQHVYDCDACEGSGKVACNVCEGYREVNCSVCTGSGKCNCTACNGKGRSACTVCGGKGMIEKVGQSAQTETCVSCSGSGNVVCTSCSNGKVLCVNCGGNGKVGCDHCRATGAVSCEKCKGHKKLTCTVCYGDNIDNRYGKINCKDCATTGEIICLSFVETKITVENTRRLAWKGTNEFEEDINLSRIEKYVQADSPLQVVYNKVNVAQPFERYDDHSRAISKMVLEQDKISKNAYPLLIQEAMYYEPVPVVTHTYLHITSGEKHRVSVLNFDREAEVIFHSLPSTKDTIHKMPSRGYGYFVGKAFYAKAYRNSTDRRNELRLMIHLAKANGFISEREKLSLQKFMDEFKNMHPIDRAYLEECMSAKTSPPLQTQEVRFSTPDRADDAISNVRTFIPVSEQDAVEKNCIDDIIILIESAKQKPVNKFKQFYATWQVSLPLLGLMMMLIFFSYLFLNKIPEQRAHVLHEELNQKVNTINWKLSQEDTSGVRDQILLLTHYSNLPLPDSPNVAYKIHWQHVQVQQLNKLGALEDALNKKAAAAAKKSSSKKKKKSK